MSLNQPGGHCGGGKTSESTGAASEALGIIVSQALLRPVSMTAPAVLGVLFGEGCGSPDMRLSPKRISNSNSFWLRLYLWHRLLTKAPRPQPMG